MTRLVQPECIQLVNLDLSLRQHEEEYFQYCHRTHLTPYLLPPALSLGEGREGEGANKLTDYRITESAKDCGTIEPVVQCDNFISLADCSCQTVARSV